MQEIHTQLLERSQNLPVHPQLKKARKANRIHFFIFFICLLLLVGSLSCFFLFNSFFHFSSFFRSLLYFFVFLILAVLVMSVHGIGNRRMQLSFWQRMEIRRQAVQQSDQHPFPIKQVSPDAGALPLPFLLRQRPGKMWMVGILFMLTLSITLILWGWQKYPSYFSDDNLTGFQLIATGIVCAIVMLMELYRRYRLWRKPLLLTEDGLVVSGRGYHKRILSWDEACLFAFEGSIVRGRESFTLLFELASPHEAIFWEWMIHINPDLPPQTDASLFSQGVDLQLDAILSLIAGRTGLPLYDLQEYKMPKARRRKQIV